jgi:hypothetical protein
MSKMTMRLAVWIACREAAALFHVDDQRATVALAVLGIAAAFFAFVDSTSYRSVRKQS